MFKIRGATVASDTENLQSLQIGLKDAVTETGCTSDRAKVMWEGRLKLPVCNIIPTHIKRTCVYGVINSARENSTGGHGVSDCHDL